MSFVFLSGRETAERQTRQLASLFKRVYVSSNFYYFSAMESGSVNEIKGPKLLQIPFPDKPAAIKVLQPVEEDHTFLINIDALEKILCDPKIAGKNVSPF
jgi:hypothetical protein